MKTPLSPDDVMSRQAVRDAAFVALGMLASASRIAAKSEVVAGEKRPAKKASAERVVSGCVRACLVAPLLDAVVHSKREVRMSGLPAQGSTTLWIRMNPRPS